MYCGVPIITPGCVELTEPSINGPSLPLNRGGTLVIYATGLGATTVRGGLGVANTTVTVVLNGVELPVAYAGLTPGFQGLYQVNVAVPAQTPYWESATVPGVYFAGTLSQGSGGIKKHGVPSNSGAVHGHRYNARVLAEHIAVRHFGIETARQEVKPEAVVGRQMTDKCIQVFMKGELDAVDAAMAKMWLSNMHCRVVDECLQLFGGWGYMWEYPIARAYADARIVKIAGGSIEVMKHIIGRHLFAKYKPHAESVPRAAGLNPA